MTSCQSNVQPFVVENKRSDRSANEGKGVSELNGGVAVQYERSKDKRPCQSLDECRWVGGNNVKVEGSELLIQNRRRASFCLMSANDAASAQRADGEAVVWP